MLQVAPADGQNPAVYVAFDPETMELQPKYVVTEELLEGLDGVDVSRPEAAAAAADGLSVPDLRVITDEEEVSLIGEGLPIIHGVSVTGQAVGAGMCQHWSDRGHRVAVVNLVGGVWLGSSRVTLQMCALGRGATWRLAAPSRSMCLLRNVTTAVNRAATVMGLQGHPQLRWGASHQCRARPAGHCAAVVAGGPCLDTPLVQWGSDAAWALCSCIDTCVPGAS